MLMAGFLVVSTAACAQVEVRVFVDDAVAGIARQAGEVLERDSGHSLVVVSATAGSLQQRLESELADVIFMAAPTIDALEQANRFVPGTRVDVARALSVGQPPRIYSAAMMATGENFEGARAFLHLLVGPEGREAATMAGLEPIAPTP
jgi:ABC-type molybdate transport system substrate-binding protein